MELEEILGEAAPGSAVPLHSRNRAVLSKQPFTSHKAGKHVRKKDQRQEGLKLALVCI